MGIQGLHSHTGFKNTTIYLLIGKTFIIIHHYIHH